MHIFIPLPFLLYVQLATMCLSIEVNLNAPPRNNFLQNVILNGPLSFLYAFLSCGVMPSGSPIAARDLAPPRPSLVGRGQYSYEFMAKEDVSFISTQDIHEKRRARVVALLSPFIEQIVKSIVIGIARKWTHHSTKDTYAACNTTEFLYLLLQHFLEPSQPQLATWALEVLDAPRSTLATMTATEKRTVIARAFADPSVLSFDSDEVLFGRITDLFDACRGYVSSRKEDEIARLEDMARSNSSSGL